MRKRASILAWVMKENIIRDYLRAFRWREKD